MRKITKNQIENQKKSFHRTNLDPQPDIGYKFNVFMFKSHNLDKFIEYYG